MENVLLTLHGAYDEDTLSRKLFGPIQENDQFLPAFEEAKVPFDPVVAKSLEKNILAAGGSEEPAILYKKFRGRLPDPSAMIKARGLN